MEITQGKHVLWPHMRWSTGHDKAEYAKLREHGLSGEIVFTVPEVTDEQFRNANAIISLPDVPKTKHQLLENCKIFVTPKVGFDNINLEAYGELGIPVCNVPDYGTTEVADHSIALMLTLMKSVHTHSSRLQEDPVNNWKNSTMPIGRRLSKSTFGVVGLGRIGTAAALRAKAFGMDVVFYDPYLSQGVDRSLGLRRVNTLQELAVQSDVMSLHTPLTYETKEFINKDVFDAAKKGIIIINTARGFLINFIDLFDAMKSNQVAAIGLDVIPEEIHEGKSGNPKHLEVIRAWCDGEPWIQNRIVMTPHTAYLTPESSMDMRTFPVDVVARYLNDGVLVNCVNEKFLKFKR